MTAPAERERQPLHEATRALLAGCGCPRCETALATLADEPDAAAGARSADPRAGGGAALSAARLERMDATLRELALALREQSRARRYREPRGGSRARGCGCGGVWWRSCGRGWRGWRRSPRREAQRRGRSRSRWAVRNMARRRAGR